MAYMRMSTEEYLDEPTSPTLTMPKGKPDTTNANRFDIDGPQHMMPLTEIDWSSEEHRRCIAACIANGTSVLANKDYNHIAPPWWENFHFKLYKELKGDDEYAFGALYEFVGETAPSHPLTPAYVMAFRGTMLAHKKPLYDLSHIGKVITNDLRNCKHFDQACKEIGDLVKKSSAATVWLVGHSLGASFALEVGRHVMIENEFNLPTFLFNPPQVSMEPVIKCLNLPKKTKNDLYSFIYNVKYKLGKTKAMKAYTRNMEELFEKLSPWKPLLYVHEEDIICQGFIEYFEQRELLSERIPNVAQSAMVLSFRDMISSLFGEKKEQPHLLPSAILWKVTKESHNEDAHALKQWWMPNKALGWSSSETGKLYGWRCAPIDG
uniref:Fungal lipase-type domain-containing protein n=1 Tax=Leersia perrieri TaxID=77586 RepID=A0A0D9WYY4_9ORYZ